MEGRALFIESAAILAINYRLSAPPLAVSTRYFGFEKMEKKTKVFLERF